MTAKIIAPEEREGPTRHLLQRAMRMVPERDRDDKKLQRLLTFRLNRDGESATHEYLILRIRDFIKCAYIGSLYDFLKDDEVLKTCNNVGPEPPSVA